MPRRRRYEPELLTEAERILANDIFVRLDEAYQEALAEIVAERERLDASFARALAHAIDCLTGCAAPGEVQDAIANELASAGRSGARSPTALKEAERTDPMRCKREDGGLPNPGVDTVQ
jgi:hypothetical protein